MTDTTAGTTTTAAATTTAATTGAAATTGTTTAAATAPWFGDKIDATTIGFWQNKGIDPNDPIVVASKLTDFYRNAEKMIGAPADEMVRIPRPNAAEADIKNYLGKLGVPAEPKDYDLSGVKFADGKELELSFADTLRAALHDGRVPKDRAATVAARLIKHMESNDAAELAEKTAAINAERAALKQSWGANEPVNKVIATKALESLAAAAGISAEKAQQAMDLLSTVGGIGAASVWEMLRVAGTKMGEAPYIGSQPGNSGSTVMSRDQAAAEIDSLKRDKEFGARLLAGDRESRRKWDDLHRVAYPRPSAA
jgi:hypothetical protein